MSTIPDTFAALGERLDARSARLARLDTYYAGSQPLSFLAPEARKRLGDRLDRVAVNLPRVVVDTLVERLRVTGLTVGGQPAPDLAAAWTRCDLAQLAAVVHREALVAGSSYAVVWADAAGRARVSVESARQVACAVDPGSRQIGAALKRWEAGGKTHAVLFEADRVRRYVADQPGATTAGWRLVNTVPNPLGTVPVARFVNATRLLDVDGTSEMADVIPLADAVVKLTTDMLTASEYGARPRRWATGVELEEDEDGNAVNPYPENDRMMVAEEDSAKFGQLPGGDLGGYEAALGILMRQVSAVTGLPEGTLGIGGDNPTSADGQRASEAAQTARAEGLQRMFGPSWERVGRLVRSVEAGVDPESVDVGVLWADPATRSVAQEADAVVKLVQAGVLPVTFALKRLGYTDPEVEAIRAARRTEALDGQGLDLLALTAPRA